MARKPSSNKPESIIPEGVPVGHEETLQNQRDLAQIAGSYSDERDLMNQILGQVQMARAISKFTDVVGLTKLAHIKESKMYRAIAGKKGLDSEGNEIPDVGTWDGFCRLIGTSANKIDEDLLNLRIFGEEALENLSRIGAGYRELRNLRKLPEGDKIALIEMAKAGDKESLVELVEDLVTKHAKEKEVAEKQLAELAADQAATEKVLGDKNKKLEKLEKRLSKFELGAMPWDERISPFKEEITNRQSVIEEALSHHISAIEALDALAGETGEDDAGAQRQISSVALHLEDLVNRCALMVGEMQRKLYDSFTHEIQTARTNLMRDPDAQQG